MFDYTPPIRDMQFILAELAGLDEVAALPGCEEASPDLVAAILDEAGKFAAGVLAHLPAISAITAPSPVSYLRLTPNRWADRWLRPRSPHCRPRAALCTSRQ